MNNVICLGSVYPHPDHIGSSGRGAVYDSNGIAPTILTMCGGGNHPFVIVFGDFLYEDS